MFSDNPAHYGKRAVALLIDWLLLLAIGMAGAILGGILLVAAGIGVLVWLITPLAMLGFSIWNSAYKQGTTGQSIGKKQQGIAIKRTDTGGVPGFGLMILRELIFYVFNTLTGGIFLIVDYLYPVWDANGQRVMDKMLKTLIVEADSMAAWSGSGSGSLPPPPPASAYDPFR